VNEEGKMFSITPYHNKLTWTDKIQSAVLLNNEETAEMVKQRYTTFLAKSRPMKLLYNLYE
jgi:hypothetical protein